MSTDRQTQFVNLLYCIHSHIVQIYNILAILIFYILVTILYHAVVTLYPAIVN